MSGFCKHGVETEHVHKCPYCALEAKDQRIAEFTQIARELIRNADYDTGSAGQVYVDEGSLQALGRVLASEDTRKEASDDPHGIWDRGRDMIEWQRITADEPKDRVRVETKIDDANGERNVATLCRQGALWFLPDMSMYVYYQPTHWRPSHE